MSLPAWPHISLGKPSFPLVIFLHGFLGSGEDWQDTAALLADGYHCLLPDLPGHGTNPSLPDHVLSYEWLVEELHEFVQALSTRPVLVGYSLGGRLALAAAIRYPDLLAGLVVESANPGINDPVERAARRAWDDSKAQQLVEQGMGQFLTEWYQMPLFASLSRKPELLAHLLDRRMQNTPAANARVISELSPGSQPSLWKELKNIRIPTLLLAGELDEKYTSIMQKIKEEIPGSKLAVIEDAGHNAHLEQPEIYAKVLRFFLPS